MRGSAEYLIKPAQVTRKHQSRNDEALLLTFAATFSTMWMQNLSFTTTYELY